MMEGSRVKLPVADESGSIVKARFQEFLQTFKATDINIDFTADEDPMNPSHEKYDYIYLIIICLF